MNILSDFTLKSVSLFQRRNFAEKVPDAANKTTAGEIRSATVTDFEKKILVWTKKFKSIEEVPARVA